MCRKSFGEKILNYAMVISMFSIIVFIEPCDFLGTKHTNLSAENECVIVQATHGGPKSRETRNSF